ncbi:MAG TPA: serine hydrolase [Steroidobacteraceae bacterium]|jgi:CubicO group peptidase (beta-lactamase class C family)
MYLSMRETPSSRHGILRRGLRALLPAGALLVLAACGGGGGGGNPPAPPATNNPPVVSAGADQTITLPTATVSLAGSATDDGPAASLTYQWTSSDATNTTFSAATSAATDATFAVAGSYTLTLTVNDGTQSASDTLTVTVNDAPPTADVFPAPDVDDNDPDHGWSRVADAASVGMDQAGLDAAAAFAQATPAGAGPGNGMIVRHGQLVMSWGDIDNSSPEVKSVTKSMGGIALGLAIDDGKLALTDKAITHMPTFGTPPDVNATKGAADVTIAQLATHTAAFPKPGGYEELADALLPVGSHWSYSDGGLNWLADTLTETYAQDLADLLNTRVWSVIGLRVPDDVRWRPMAQGFRPDPRAANPTIQYRELASGIQTNVNAMARVGLLFLRKGVWDGNRVVSEAFVNQVQTPLPANAGITLSDPTNFPGALTNYGVLWWTNKGGQMQGVPTDTFWAWGLGEALIVVIPSLDLVIARNGGQANANSTPGQRVWNDDFWNGDPAVIQPFIKPIVDATTP